MAAPATPPAVSVILISWNTRDLLDACLANVRPQVDDLGGDVWVVDNDSADGSADMVARRHPWVHLLRNDANEGFARACNRVVPQTAGRFLFFFNPDATLDAGCLRALRDVMDARPRLGALMPRLLNAQGQPTHFVGRAPRMATARLRLYRAMAWRFSHVAAVRSAWERASTNYLRHSATQGGPFPRAHLEGAALMVRRSALDAVGLFDPGFFCGWEETDLTIRLRAAGWELAETPAASVRHWDQQSRLQWKNRPWEIPDGYYFVRKHHGRLALLRHALVERRRFRYHAAIGAPVAELRAEQARVVRALLRAPEHPGYPYDWTRARPNAAS